MDSRERVMRAVNFEGPDRVPISYAGIYQAAYEKYGESLKKILAKYLNDFSHGGLSSTGVYRREISEKGAHMKKYVDEWGCTWAKLHEGLEGQCIGHPLARWELLNEYVFPEPPVFTKVLDADQSKYIMVGSGTIFERMQQLRGFQNLLVDLIQGRKEVDVLLDGILKYNLEVVRRLLEIGVDAIYFADDWGTQTGLMVSPKIWRDLFKPAYGKMFVKVHAAGKHVFFHSDGYIKEILPDLISCGMDVFYPQFGVASVEEWEETCGGKVCIIASVDVQHVLPRGTVEDVEQYGKNMIRTLGSYDGGLINAPEVAWDIPIDNIEAAFDVFWEHGRYPALL